MRIRKLKLVAAIVAVAVLCGVIGLAYLEDLRLQGACGKVSDQPLSHSCDCCSKTRVTNRGSLTAPRTRQHGFPGIVSTVAESGSENPRSAVPLFCPVQSFLQLFLGKGLDLAAHEVRSQFRAPFDPFARADHG